MCVKKSNNSIALYIFSGTSTFCERFSVYIRNAARSFSFRNTIEKNYFITVPLSFQYTSIMKRNQLCVPGLSQNPHNQNGTRHI